MIKNKKILVTGGAGTVGCNIVKKLVDRNAEVTVVDNLSAYPFDYLKDYGVGDISAVNFVHAFPTVYERSGRLSDALADGTRFERRPGVAAAVRRLAGCRELSAALEWI